jgi:beta-glucosidase
VKTVAFLAAVFVSAVAVVAGGAAQRLPAQPTIGARVKQILRNAGGLSFKDLNDNGILDPYEDWRLDAETRVNDLLPRMSRSEKAGLMLIDTLNADCGGAVPAVGVDFVNKESMSHFIFRKFSYERAGLRGQPGS